MFHLNDAQNEHTLTPYPRTQEFLSVDRKTIMHEYTSLDAETLEQAGFQSTLRLFHEAAERIPAYRDFLNKHNIRAKTINTYQDFQRVPVTNKKNYLRAYSLKELCWDGNLKGLSLLSSSSGSTGEPFVWPWGEAQKAEGALELESVFPAVFEMERYSTLYIDCFAMGTWIGGMFTCASMEYLSLKGYPLLTITPGLDKNSTFELFQKIAPEFDQIIFGGYPPFIKGLLEEGQGVGIDWKQHRIKFFFAAEGFSERWRDRVHQLIGATDPLTTSISIYGSADAAIMAYETPLTTAIRRAVCDEPQHMHYLFSKSHLPTLAQYDPRFKFFEALDQSFVFTTRSGIPLIRYNIGDTGSVYMFHDLERRLAELNIDMQHLLPQDAQAKYYWKLPFVYLFGRSDLTISLYGLLIYPEHVKFGLERQAFQEAITGKFVMAVDFDDDQNPYFHLAVELAPGIQPDARLRDEIQRVVVEGLREINREYHDMESVVRERVWPRVEIVEYNSSANFRIGTKQKWVKQ